MKYIIILLLIIFTSCNDDKIVATDADDYNTIFKIGDKVEFANLKKCDCVINTVYKTSVNLICIDTLKNVHEVEGAHCKLLKHDNNIIKIN